MLGGAGIPWEGALSLVCRSRALPRTRLAWEGHVTHSVLHACHSTPEAAAFDPQCCMQCSGDPLHGEGLQKCPLLLWSLALRPPARAWVCLVIPSIKCTKKTSKLLHPGAVRSMGMTQWPQESVGGGEEGAEEGWRPAEGRIAGAQLGSAAPHQARPQLTSLLASGGSQFPS